MARGRQPTPTSILKLRGSWRAKTRPHEPQPPALRPACPQWLDGEARTLWKHLTPQLVELGVLTLLDRNALTRYVVAWTEWKTCRESLAAHGSFYNVYSQEGLLLRVRTHPLAVRELQLSRHLLELEQQFGMTPSGRAKLGAVPQKPTPPRRPPS